ncbi:inositol polyphosphate-5-phosphatase A-like isoform X2 [Octopus sinensis]|uniref:inositol-polyphosphate 5-phosphatase n=1 Tax=Octopus sinensis TaxID=2607531 RepID=A0A6P7T6H0_9MOLL|nr:inositol polyphosphate-5-phosphatase A-like isoform X2 [Octopus sinensis]
MGDNGLTRILLVSANVGSIFEDPDNTLKLWLREFQKCLHRTEPRFLAVHCQEVGGKNYEDSMQHVNNFVTSLLGCDELQNFDRVRVFLDEDFTAADKFTALGNLYFVHVDVDVAEIWDFEASKFLTVEGREVQSGNIENVTVKEKAKFPQRFYPDFKWSRKGFLRTRWNINNCAFDLCNIHLFHDASNIIAMQNSPSVYCGNRKEALRHTLQRFDEDKFEKLPMFIFGDFNFRLDSHLLIKELTDKTLPQHTKGKKDQLAKIVFIEADNNEKAILTVESKQFNYHDKHTEFFYNKNNMLQQYDTELDAFKDQISEFEISFPPSYPFSEDTNDGLSYMKTRCPSWCDRVLFNHRAKDIIVHNDEHRLEYDVIGHNTCMGDHKPVYLLFHVKNGPGNSPQIPTSTRHLRRNTLSVNGEDMSDVEIAKLNIHDYAVFEYEQRLLSNFRNSVRSRNYAENHLSKSSLNGAEESRISFHDTARQVLMAESVLMNWQRHMKHHSSSSEDFIDTSLDDLPEHLGKSNLDNLDQASTLTLLSSEYYNPSINTSNLDSNSLILSQHPTVHAPSLGTPADSGGSGRDGSLSSMTMHEAHSTPHTTDVQCACNVVQPCPDSVSGKGTLAQSPRSIGVSRSSSLAKRTSWLCPSCTVV